MAEGPYLMGIDVGTGGVRVGLFDPEGTPLVFRGEDYETSHPRPGWAEQDPDTMWTALVGAVRGALEESGVAPDAVAGMALDAMACTLVALDERARPLRPAIMWMDVRAAEQAARVAQTGDPALKYTGFGPVSAEWGLPKAMWLKEHERRLYDAAARICDSGDWLTHRLTGEWKGSVNYASSKFLYDRDEGGWPESLYAAVDAEDLLERLPPEITDLGSVVGALRADVAEELGLKAGIPVAQGGVDAYVGALGLGVVEPGKLAIITGSSHVMIAQAAEPIHGRGLWGAFPDAMIPGQYSIETGQAATGTIVAWFKDRFAGDAVAEAKRRGVDPYDVLTEMALKVPVGSEGLIVLDDFQGNRTPHVDPLARGMIWGLTLSHGPGHVFRAIIEGICYGTENILRTMRANDFEPQVNVVSGGPAKSELWMQLHADVSNIPIAHTKVGEGPVLGSAMLAAVGAGIHPDAGEAAAQMVHTERVLEPDLERHEAYKFFVDRYIETYPRMKELMHETVRHVSASGTPAAA